MKRYRNNKGIFVRPQKVLVCFVKQIGGSAPGAFFESVEGLVNGVLGQYVANDTELVKLDIVDFQGSSYLLIVLRGVPKPKEV